MDTSTPQATSANFDGEWAALLTAELAADKRPAGEGWRTVREIHADTPGIAYGALAMRLRAMFEAGRIDRAPGGGHGSVVFYRPKRN